MIGVLGSCIRKTSDPDNFLIYMKEINDTEILIHNMSWDFAMAIYNFIAKDLNDPRIGRFLDENTFSDLLKSEFFTASVRDTTEYIINLDMPKMNEIRNSQEMIDLESFLSQEIEECQDYYTQLSLKHNLKRKQDLLLLKNKRNYCQKLKKKWEKLLSKHPEEKEFHKFRLKILEETEIRLKSEETLINKYKYY